MGHGRDGRRLAGQIARIALVSALLGGFGVVVGALVRNQVVAVVGMLLLSFVIEPAVIGLVPEVGRYGPFVALPTAAVGLPEGDAGLGDVDLLPAGLAVALMLAWIAAAFAPDSRCYAAATWASEQRQTPASRARPARNRSYFHET